jgi:hypothetical protein
MAHLDLLKSKILLADDEDGFGYVASLGLDGTVYVKLWSPNDAETKVMFYPSTETLYEKAKSLVDGPLANHSDFHIAQNKLFQAFIGYHEDKQSMEVKG